MNADTWFGLLSIGAGVLCILTVYAALVKRERRHG